MFLLDSRLFGKKLVSLPFAPYGGVCSESKDATDSLIAHAKVIADTRDVKFLELRYFNNIASDLTQDDRYFTSILELNPNPTNLWDSFDKKVRNSTRKALKSKVELLSGGKYLPDFYKVYSRSVRDLGTPVHDYNFFKNVLIEFPKSEIMVAEHKGEIIASLFLVHFKDTVISAWAGSLKECRDVCPNNLLYWSAIKSGCENGFSYFDFGRSISNSGVFRYKQAWGAETKQLHYQYYLRQNKIPDISQRSTSRNKFANIWKRLPLPIANKLGPMLRRHYS
jgi:FemAB-related protein (PEP-CTERM system-associated)